VKFLAVLAALPLGACGSSARPEKIAKQPAEKFPAGAADCSDASPTTFEALEAATGTRIALDGAPTVGVACTEMECTDGRACCNRCGGEYALHDPSRHQINLRGLPGCTGMDCNTVCEPFGRSPTRSYRFVGVYDHAQRVLTVEKFCALTQDPR